MQHALPKIQQSEPFLWFVLEVLETAEAVHTFTEMGGMNVLCQSLVRSNRSLINMQPGLVSIIMQHISKAPKHKQSASSNGGGTTTSITNNNGSSSAAVSSHVVVMAGKRTAGTSSGSGRATADGLINFAPFCNITTENSTAQSPDVLIQAPIASHRRARTPAWTYLFYPNESHIDLIVTLPTAVLLKEVHMQPHLPSLASCPSAVALEINRDNTLAPIPISQPMSTVGLTCIKLKLPQPEIASSIVLRLYRPKDSTSIGLTQVSVLGSTVFTNSAQAGSDYCDDDVVTKPSLGWLRILARCFSVATFDAQSAALAASVIQSAANYPGFLEACCSLLNVTVTSPTSALQNLQTVLLRMGLHSRELGLKLIDTLLRSTLPQTFKLCNDSVSDLLYEICTTIDAYTCDRVGVMIDWVQALYARCHQQRRLLRTNPYSGFVKCLASILWNLKNGKSLLQPLITAALFDACFAWTDVLKDKDPLKLAIDSMLCSICYLRPELFPLLLRKMGVLVVNPSTDHAASISDDRKDTEGMTDDTKHAADDAGEWYSHLVIQDLTKLSLTPAQLRTIGVACQSKAAVRLLVDSGLPYLLSLAILEFCSNVSDEATLAGRHSTTHSPSSSASSSSFSSPAKCSLSDMDKIDTTLVAAPPLCNINMISEILDFFSDSCSEGHMRDWLGSTEGASFWMPLLNMLCNEKTTDLTSDRLFSLNRLEAATIKFLSRVTTCHPKNQEHMTVILIGVINKRPNLLGAPKNIISGFTRRLVLQLLLESERILVSVRSEVQLEKRDCPSTATAAPINNHPSMRPNAHDLLFYVSTHTKCQDILDACMVSPNLSGSGGGADAAASLARNGGGTGSGRGTTAGATTAYGGSNNATLLRNCIAAGVTAKDKRLKEAKNQLAAMKAKELQPMLTSKCRKRGAASMQTTKYLTFFFAELFADGVGGGTGNGGGLTTTHHLMHADCPTVSLSSDTSISQVLAMLRNANVSLATPCIVLQLVTVSRPLRFCNIVEKVFFYFIL